MDPRVKQQEDRTADRSGRYVWPEDL